MRTEEILGGFEGRRILVVGDVFVDEYLEGECTRISPEAPVPVLRIESERQVLGGAANTAANIASLGGRPVLIGLAGEDAAGADFRRIAAGLGIGFRGVSDGRPTIRKTRLVGQRQQLLRIDYEDTRDIGADTEGRILAIFREELPACDIVVLPDYAKGLLTANLCRALIDEARAVGRRVVVDPRPQHGSFYQGADYLTPNWKEGLGLLGAAERPITGDSVRETGSALAARYGSSILLTLGPQGMSFHARDGGENFSLPTVAKEVFDVSGAGDTVVATFALALGCGCTDREAAALANRAAGIVVGKFGTATLTREELLRQDDDRRVLDPESLTVFGEKWRVKRKRVVAVAGRFETPRPADIRALQEFRRQGDLLVAGILLPRDSDAAEWLQALRCVDYVCPLERLGEEEFFRRLRPEVRLTLANGEGNEAPIRRAAGS